MAYRPTIRVPGTAMQREQMLMFCVMLIAAIGNTGLQSVLPAIGRTIGLADSMVALAFSFSALLWAFAAPMWSRRLTADRTKKMVLIGMGGFTLSLLIGGSALAAGVLGWVSATAAFALFVVGRGIYGSFGAAAPPAAQAIVVASVPRAERTTALTLLASAFGLGTIIGPALAPFFVLPVVGLAGPAFVFAAMGIAMMVLVQTRLPAQSAQLLPPVTPDNEPAIGYEPIDAVRESDDLTDAQAASPAGAGRITFRDARIRAWLICGIVAVHAQAIVGQTMAFLVIDRLRISPAEAQPLIGLVLTAGAGATLLAQWGVIPRLNLEPRAMVLWGIGIAAVGCGCIALRGDLHTLAICFALASLGFGFVRPGFTAGASLAVTEAEQGAVAGYVTSANGLAFIAAPSIGILLYQVWRPLPYLVCAALMAGLLLFALRAFPAPGRQEQV